MSLNNLTDNERLVLVSIVESHIKSVVRETRNIELTLSNPPLSSQYPESYLVMLRGNKIGLYDKIRELKILINKIMKEVVYGEDETGKKEEFYGFK